MKFNKIYAPLARILCNLKGDKNDSFGYSQ